MTFNPAAIAQNIILTRVRRSACHFSVAVECVRLSDVSRIASGYDAFGALLKSGALVISADGVLSAR